MGRIKTHILDHRKILNEVFIETGTFRGESLEFASSLPFNELHSCDVSARHYNNAVEKFKNNKKINLHHESSHTLLRKIIDPKKSTTFWLDGHWQNLGADEIDIVATECPLKVELEQIFEKDWVVPPLILIDDARHYPVKKSDKKLSKNGYDMKQWISIEEIVNMMPSGYNYKIVKDVIWIYAILL